MKKAPNSYKRATTKKTPAKAIAVTAPAPRRRRSVSNKPGSMRDQWKQRNESCDRTLVDDLTLKLAHGLPVDRACDLIGLDRGTYTKWMKWGEDYLKATDAEVAAMTKEDRARGENYAYLYMQSKKVMAQWQAGIVDKDLHGEGIWQRGIAILERRDSQNWGRPHTRQINDGDLTEKFQPDPTFL